MNKIQRISRLIRGDLSFFIIILIVIIAFFLILSPKISAAIFPLKRQAVMNNFINSTKSRGSIDPQEFWKFREFYSPGYFTFSKSGIEKSLAKKTIEEIEIVFDENNIDLTFLAFSSPLVSSLDILTTQTDLSKIIVQFPKENIIFMNKNSLIYEETPKIIKIIFLLSNSEMRRANGFFDYNDRDKQIAGSKNWFNITSIKE